MDTPDYVTPTRTSVLRLRQTPEDPDRDAKEKAFLLRVGSIREFVPHHVSHPWQIVDQWGDVKWQLHAGSVTDGKVRVWQYDGGRYHWVPLDKYLQEMLKFYQWHAALPAGKRGGQYLEDARTVLNRTKTALKYLPDPKGDPEKEDIRDAMQQLVQRLDKYSKKGSKLQYPKRLAPDWW